MFDPEHKDIDCPKCFRQRVYLDRDIGYYCMFCGHLLSAEETLVQMERRVAVFVPRLVSDKGYKTTIVEITDTRSGMSRNKKVRQRPEPHEDEKSY